MQYVSLRDGPFARVLVMRVCRLRTRAATFAAALREHDARVERQRRLGKRVLLRVQRLHLRRRL